MAIKKICSRCGIEEPATAMYCTRCGDALLTIGGEPTPAPTPAPAPAQTPPTQVSEPEPAPMPASNPQFKPGNGANDRNVRPMNNMNPQMPGRENKQSGSKNKGLIAVIIILVLVAGAMGGLFAKVYLETEDYKLSIDELTEEKENLESQVSKLETNLSSVKSDLTAAESKLTEAENARDDYKELYEDMYNAYYDIEADYQTYAKLERAMSGVSIKDSYGSFPGKVIAVKKNETVTVEIPYNYSGTLTAWTNDSYYKFTWLDSNTSGLWKFTIKGVSVGAHTLRITSNNNSDAGGITVVVWVYE